MPHDSQVARRLFCRRVIERQRIVPMSGRLGLLTLLHLVLSFLQVLRFVLPLAEKGSRDREHAGQCCRRAAARRKLVPTFCPKRFALHQFQCLRPIENLPFQSTPLFYPEEIGPIWSD